MLGVVALTVVVSVMNGFDRELKSRILGAIPHIVVSDRSPEEIRVVADGFDVEAITPFMESQVLILSENGNLMVNLFGVSPDQEASAGSLPRSVINAAKSLSHEGGELILGSLAARRLGLQPGDSVTLVIPSLGKSKKILHQNYRH